jgi:hypothetical protein
VGECSSPGLEENIMINVNVMDRNFLKVNIKEGTSHLKM